MGLWPTVAPTGYRNSVLKDRKGYVEIDPIRGHIIKMIFEKCAEGWSARKIKQWLKFDLDFRSIRNKHYSLSNVQRILENTFYYGEFEFPLKSGHWYKGIHQPLITKKLFEDARKVIRNRSHQKFIYRKNFAYTKLMKCGLCGSNVSAEEKFKNLKDGSIARYVYYGCTRARDSYCKMLYIREDSLIQQLRDLVDKLSIDDLGVRGQFDAEVERIHRFNLDVMGSQDNYASEQRDIDVKKYVKYLLSDGTIDEKRHVLLSLKSKILIKDKQVFLDVIKEEEESAETSNPSLLPLVV